MDYQAIGNRIRSLRREKHLTQGELAVQAGVSMSYMGHVERGTRIMSVDTLCRLCQALGCTADALLGLAPGSLRNSIPTEWTPERRQTALALLADVALLLGEPKK